MSRWNHPICERCWTKWHDHEPVRLSSTDPERCCWCGRQTKAGIYVRQDPFAVPKHRVGDHEEE